MDLFMKIGSALLIGAMIIYMYPNAKRMMQNSPEAQKGDWASFVVPVLFVGVFVLLLMTLI
tara:strand:+ start:171 stop:353 length:183 start_codon:yes stop_codon:yes gene_type:complete